MLRTSAGLISAGSHMAALASHVVPSFKAGGIGSPWLHGNRDLGRMSNLTLVQSEVGLS